MLFSTNENLNAKIQSLTQFGFPKGLRSTHYLGTNAKLCEYIAAVGLAALDCWPETRAQWLKLINHYQIAFQKSGIQHMLSLEWVTSTCNMVIPRQADSILAMLSKAGIHTRKWWENGCHHMPAFEGCQRTELENTELLSQSVLGLPLYLDMSTDEIDRVVEGLLTIHYSHIA